MQISLTATCVEVGISVLNVFIEFMQHSHVSDTHTHQHTQGKERLIG